MPLHTRPKLYAQPSDKRTKKDLKNDLYNFSFSFIQWYGRKVDREQGISIQCLSSHTGKGKDNVYYKESRKKVFFSGMAIKRGDKGLATHKKEALFKLF